MSQITWEQTLTQACMIFEWVLNFQEIQVLLFEVKTDTKLYSLAENMKLTFEINLYIFTVGTNTSMVLDLDTTIKISVTWGIFDILILREPNYCPNISVEIRQDWSDWHGNELFLFLFQN